MHAIISEFTGHILVKLHVDNVQATITRGSKEPVTHLGLCAY